MKKRLVECVCKGKIVDKVIEKNGVKMFVQKCVKCGEIYIPGSEMLRYDMIKGKSSMARKIRKSGDSLVMTIPKKIVDKFDLRDGDFASFESGKKEIKVKILHMKRV